jgi:choline dehydrogenase
LSLTVVNALRWGVRVSQNPQFRGWRRIKNTLQYFAFRRGPMANATFEVVAWLKSQPALARPDMQSMPA